MFRAKKVNVLKSQVDPHMILTFCQLMMDQDTTIELIVMVAICLVKKVQKAKKEIRF